MNKRNREGHYKPIKGKTNQEDTAIFSITAPKTRAAKLIKETLLQLNHILILMQ